MSELFNLINYEQEKWIYERMGSSVSGTDKTVCTPDMSEGVYGQSNKDSPPFILAVPHLETLHHSPKPGQEQAQLQEPERESKSRSRGRQAGEESV